MTAADGFGIAGVGVAFVIVLVAIGAAVCFALSGDDKKEDGEK